ncbi:MAG: hypothetical protein QOD10_3972, partial [Mycobacterium sp.]|nr:hypothetical protein [Mycobacterium sp.]
MPVPLTLSSPMAAKWIPSLSFGREHQGSSVDVLPRWVFSIHAAVIPGEYPRVLLISPCYERGVFPAAS